MNEDTFLVLLNQAREMAKVCVVTGLAPSEYKQMSQIEVQQYIEEYNRVNKKK